MQWRQGGPNWSGLVSLSLSRRLNPWQEAEPALHGSDGSLSFVNTCLAAGTGPVSRQTVKNMMMLPLSSQQPLSPEGGWAGPVLLGGGHMELFLVQRVLVIKDVVYGQGGPGGRVPGPHDVGYQHLPAHDSVVTRTLSYAGGEWPEWN